MKTSREVEGMRMAKSLLKVCQVRMMSLSTKRQLKLISN
jgi:hypothetical protein